MECKENCVTDGIVILWGLLLIQLLALQLASASAPSNALPGCQQRCGDVEIPYPFGIGPNCSMNVGFALNCTSSNGTHKPFLNDVEFLNISLSSGQARIFNRVSALCHDGASSNATYNHSWPINLTALPYRFSSTLNKFTTVGCQTVAFATMIHKTHQYWSGCTAVCEDVGSLTNGSCSGTGCCETAIPKGISSYDVQFLDNFNSSDTYWFSPCGYAMLVEEAAFEFSTSYVTTGALRDRKLPLVLDWAVRNKTCRQARRNRTSYACVSDNSECVDSGNGPGYLCNCSQGYQGNPYLPHGCRGTNGNPYINGTCNPILTLRVNVAIGVSASLVTLMIITLCIYIIRERKRLTDVKEKYFQQYGGRLLLAEIEKIRGLAFRIFTKEELEEATNKFDMSNVIGHGGNGTVYKGVLKDYRVVAIKKAKIIDEKQKEEFGKEVIILAQINHKNIVKLLGCCLEVEVPMLVYEFVSKGNLFQLLHGKSPRVHVIFETRLRIAAESAEALAYLHSSASPPIIHGDVKSSNILLDDRHMAKVADFGASRSAPMNEVQYVTLVQGTLGYLDPEYMQTYELTDKSDVYSFGVVLLELLTGKNAVSLEGSEEARSLSSKFLVAMKVNGLYELLDDQIKDDEEIELIKAVAALARTCLSIKREERPSMKDVAEELGRLRKLKQNCLEHHKPIASFDYDHDLGDAAIYHSLEQEVVMSIESR
ncbi:Wall-associated receptor kinase 2 [Ananas comosus]|uniref:Wall-associated receptor kinase 2 n=1 Tax=Ananas comosus TaxID=4615 RepID=A0A199W047_ANACO|nr:Wall-associated receptor kinase 2 [Ananas comosus]